MSSTETIAVEHQRLLLDVARSSIWQGVREGRALTVKAADYPEPLQAQRATFVTLNVEGRLCGCIGALAAYQPLVCDVAEHAHAAAFQDPRFPPVVTAEVNCLELHISILSPPQPMSFSDEADLLTQMRPGVDGLILGDGGRRGTFLPSVWEQLPQPGEFLTHLKRKAGLPGDYWSDTLEVSRYTTQSFS